MKFKTILLTAAILLLGIAGYGATGLVLHTISMARLGKQSDGSFIAATEQRIEPGALAFDSRPIDLALHPSGKLFAVLNQQEVFLATRDGVMAGTRVSLADGAGYHGAVWNPDGTRLFVSVSAGYVQALNWDGTKLTLGPRLEIKPDGAKGNPRPGGMAVTRDGKTLFVAACDRNAVAEVDLTRDKFVREYKAQNLPFDVKLSTDEKSLIVSNWGGRIPEKDDETSESGDALIVVDPRGAAKTGTVSLIARDTGDTRTVDVGLHPNSIAIQGDNAYVADGADDTITQVNIPDGRVVRTIPIKWGTLNLFGSMPDALAIAGNTLYCCDGGDNAVCEIDLTANTVRGFRPAGFYPTGIALSADGHTAYVVNTKGNGSVRRTGKGEPGNVHDFQGTVSVIDLNADLKAATDRVAADNHWDRDRSALTPDLAVYHGAIKHVLYIIKENRTYDQVFGDIPEGNGDPKLCDLGEEVTPNAHKLVREFTLFDNGYVSGTNSADGHEWSTEALCDDYLEHFYTGYRTYPDDGTCAMARASTGALWDAALKAHKSLRDYGEHCDVSKARFDPKPKTWLDMWQDRERGTHRYKTTAFTDVPSLRPYINPDYLYWPLLMSDQQRADIFIKEYRQFSRDGKVPDLMIMSLPSDHTEGMNPDYPQPKSMVADNDLALGRIVEAVSHSPEWKETCIFVIEDDAQSGPDHIDGHRTVYLALSPYVKRHFVDHSFGNTVSMIRSIELMLGMGPMNRFDAITPPLANCFTDTPDLTPYSITPNRIALDKMNKPTAQLPAKMRYWAKRSLALDWSGPDRADPVVLNQILWHEMHGADSPYPFRQTDQ